MERDIQVSPPLVKQQQSWKNEKSVPASQAGLEYLYTRCVIPNACNGTGEGDSDEAGDPICGWELERGGI